LPAFVRARQRQRAMATVRRADRTPASMCCREVTWWSMSIVALVLA
jgi:hypothetical protein